MEICSRSAADEKTGRTILVIGDIILSQYNKGTRDLDESSLSLGGAANMAINIADIGGRVILASVIGRDQDGEAIRKMLKQKDIPAVLAVDPSRPTVVGEWTGTPIGIFHDILKLITVMMEDVNLVVIVDCGKGVVTEELMSAVCEISKPRDIPVLVVPMEFDFGIYKEADLIISRLPAIKVLYGLVNVCGEDWYKAADEIFIAGLAFGLSKGLPLKTACRAANELASLVVGRKGAKSAVPGDWNRVICSIQSTSADFF